MQMLEGFHLYPLMVDLRFRRWDEILKTPQPRGERKLLRAFWQFARAMALAGQGRPDEAAAEQTRLEALRTALPAELRYLLNRPRAMMCPNPYRGFADTPRLSSYRPCSKLLILP
jgi:hypothetical protein